MWVNVLVNKEKINRVLGNIITNACKFSHDGSVINVTTSSRDGNAVIEIKDHGIGIPLKLQPYIFEPLTSAKRYGTSGEQSFGLGLSICRQIITANNGRISMESVEGKGSTFFIELPMVL